VLAVIEKQPVTASINSQQNRRNSHHADRNSQPGKDYVFDSEKEQERT
jgi:hypothetical protein